MGRRRAIIDLYRASENETVRGMMEAALESGLSHPDAVRLALGVYKELDVLVSAGSPVTRDDFREIRNYARAILRSGSTFQSFEIATRAIAAWRLLQTELATLHDEWSRRDVAAQLKFQQKRQEANLKGRGFT